MSVIDGERLRSTTVDKHNKIVCHQKPIWYPLLIARVVVDFDITFQSQLICMILDSQVILSESFDLQSSIPYTSEHSELQL